MLEKQEGVLGRGLVRKVGSQPARMVKVGAKRPVGQAGRPTAVELERRKGRVMEVATDLFVTRGFAATSLVDIAKVAGVATRTLYQHFGDKEAIFQEVIFARDAATRITAPAIDPSKDLFQNLMMAADYACAIALQPRSADLMRLMIAESRRFPDLIKHVATTTFRRFRGTIQRIFAALAAEGMIPDDDHAKSSELFIDFVLGNAPIMLYANWSTEPPTRAVLVERVALFIRGRFGDTVAADAHIPANAAVAIG